MEKCFVCEEKVGPTGFSSYNFAVGSGHSFRGMPTTLYEVYMPAERLTIRIELNIIF